MISHQIFVSLYYWILNKFQGNSEYLLKQAVTCKLFERTRFFAEKAADMEYLGKEIV